MDQIWNSCELSRLSATFSIALYAIALPISALAWKTSMSCWWGGSVEFLHAVSAMLAVNRISPFDVSCLLRADLRDAGGDESALSSAINVVLCLHQLSMMVDIH